ncbi:dehydrogenase/reductase SDR family member on chromosome X isoform X2 [Bacillus rossius redtenbacheri]
MSCDMHVVIGCRNVKQGNEALARLKSAGAASGSAECLHVDMASLASVRRFAEEVLARCPRINVLVNNAGIMFAPFELTEDGFESHLAVNYLGHCLLTHLLLPRLASSAAPGVSSRVVNVSSCAHECAAIDFQDLNTLNRYLGTVAYGRSKLAQVLFTRALERRLRAAGAPVQAHAVHPGLVDTDLFHGTAVKLLLPWALKLLFKTPEQGAVPVLYAAVGTELEGAGGTYISNCSVVPCSEAAARETTQEQLWARMMGMLQLETFGGL